ncbi:MAG: hypothetical protein KDE47_15325 [Caldilineaceae bacterium]|nr:hypothetical protein [Caldilineaceae bacterium]
MQRASQLAQETGYVRVILDIPELVKALPAWEDAVLAAPLPAQPVESNMDEAISLTR